ncbi:MAG TPA: NPCBM/NEW2 domain-containing protein [Thermoguttaceae bacterium]|nr:NPCBM/NEW2 domain-containing protein [Thermoguttaceae bacterium]
MGNLILASLILMTAADVQVRTVDGSRVEGRFVTINADRVVIETSTGNRSLGTSELMNLEPTIAPAAINGSLPVAILLTDGSTFRAERFVTANGQAETAAPSGPAKCPLGAIRYVRLADAQGAAAAEWDRLLREPFESDVLVTRRDESLDYHRGVVGDVSATTVAFEIDGEVLQVKRTKVFGWIYYHPPGDALPRTVATLIDSRGSRWSVRDVSLSGDVLKVTTPAGVAVECPMAQLARLDFSEGKMLDLGELQPRSVEWTPYWGLAKEPASREAFFAPLRHPSADGPAMTLGGKIHARGVALCSRTEVEYDLPEGYRRLTALAGIDDAFRPGGDARLVISADGRTLLDVTLTGTEPPRAIDLDVAGARRLTILVDFGRAMDVGDHVNLCEARLVK